MKTAKEVRAWMDAVEPFGLFGNQEFWEAAKMYIGAFEQIQWERDVAINQLRELGYGLGERKHE